jgi:hypothetical protein
VHKNEIGIDERFEWILGELSQRDDVGVRTGLFDCVRSEHRSVLHALDGAI